MQHIFATAKINNKNMDMHPIYFFKRLKSIIKNMNMHTTYGGIGIIDNEKDFENNLNNYIVITFRNKYWLWIFTYTKNVNSICLNCMMFIAFKHMVNSQK